MNIEEFKVREKELKEIGIDENIINEFHYILEIIKDRKFFLEITQEKLYDNIINCRSELKGLEYGYLIEKEDKFGYDKVYCTRSFEMIHDILINEIYIGDDEEQYIYEEIIGEFMEIFNSVVINKVKEYREKIVNMVDRGEFRR